MALSDANYLNAPLDIIRHVLAGEFSLDAHGNRRIIDDYMRFHASNANYPRPSHAIWIYSQMVRWGQVVLTEAGIKAAASAYRPDLYRTALEDFGCPSDDDLRIEGLRPDDAFIDGHSFDPSHVAEYLAQFTLKSNRTFEAGDRDT
jgi:NitT/TauT family transport system ATP-binding protein